MPDDSRRHSTRSVAPHDTCTGTVTHRSAASGRGSAIRRDGGRCTGEALAASAAKTTSVPSDLTHIHFMARGARSDSVRCAEETVYHELKETVSNKARHSHIRARASPRRPSCTATDVLRLARDSGHACRKIGQNQPSKETTGDPVAPHRRPTSTVGAS